MKKKPSKLYVWDVEGINILKKKLFRVFVMLKQIIRFEWNDFWFYYANSMTKMVRCYIDTNKYIFTYTYTSRYSTFEENSKAFFQDVLNCRSIILNLIFISFVTFMFGLILFVINISLFSIGLFSFVGTLLILWGFINMFLIYLLSARFDMLRAFYKNDKLNQQYAEKHYSNISKNSEITQVQKEEFIEYVDDFKKEIENIKKQIRKI